jgi:protein-arginine kinase activator protein McsA
MKMRTKMITKPKYPHIHVNLIGEDGHASSIISRVQTAMRRGGLTNAEINRFINEAVAKNYDHLILTVLKWVDTDYRNNTESLKCDNCEKPLEGSDEVLTICDECYDSMPNDVFVDSWESA